MTRTQMLRCCYEAERAYMLSCGRGGLSEWISLPPSVQSSGREVHPAPFEAPFDNEEQCRVRRLVYDGVKALLEPLIDPRST